MAAAVVAGSVAVVAVDGAAAAAVDDFVGADSCSVDDLAVDG